MRIGFLGVGQIALHHAEAALALDHQVVAGSARNESSIRWQAFSKRFPEARFVSDGGALLADPEIDAVVACLPWNVAGDWLDRLLACAKPVLLEKPIALDASVARAALTRARSGIDNKWVGYNRRFYEPVEQLKSRLAEGGLKAASVTICEAISSHVSRYGNDIVPYLLAFASSHSLDLTTHLFGRLDIVDLVAHNEAGDAAGFTSYNGLLRQRCSGVPIQFSLNADDPSPAGIRCRFDDQTTWHLGPLETLTVYQGYDIVPPTETHPVRRYEARAIQSSQANLDHKPGFLAQMHAFTTGAPAPGATIAEAVALLEFIEQMRNSAR